MGDEVEVMPVPIPCAIYEANIQGLIEKLLEIDEMLFQAEIRQEEPARAECYAESA